MKLGYQQATISFCVDLTSPNGVSFPVANLLVGEAEGRQIAGVAVIVPDNVDPLSKAVLGDMHQLIKKYVDEAFQKRAPEAPLGDVLARVYHSLRNTMHVSLIAEPAVLDVDVAAPAQLGGVVINLLHDGLLNSLRAAGFKVEPTQTARPSAKRPWPDPEVLELPPSLVWAPPSATFAVAAG